MISPKLNWSYPKQNSKSEIYKYKVAFVSSVLAVACSLTHNLPSNNSFETGNEPLPFLEPFPEPTHKPVFPRRDIDPDLCHSPTLTRPTIALLGVLRLELHGLIERTRQTQVYRTVIQKRQVFGRSDDAQLYVAGVAGAARWGQDVAQGQSNASRGVGRTDWEHSRSSNKIIWVMSIKIIIGTTKIKLRGGRGWPTGCFLYLSARGFWVNYIVILINAESKRQQTEDQIEQIADQKQSQIDESVV